MPAEPGAASRTGCAILGQGRLGRLIAEALLADPDGPALVGTLGRGGRSGPAAAASLDEILARRPAVVVECASAEALAAAGPSVLAAGAVLVPLSLAAFADEDAASRLTEAARRGPGRIEIPSGAAGALPLVAAALVAGLRSVAFRQAYPVAGWRGTAAEGLVDLDAIREATTVFRGSAREAARLFPRNLNAATGVALAGLGLDRTHVELLADPGLPGVRYDLALDAEPGPVRLTIGPRPGGSGPDYTAYTVLAHLRRRVARIAI
ncbi:aspartate dehydrogenase domain-containing protein [Prosthecomicrobium sp. N25]|uniref:aspartate dehydrogenase domain-containing protein n=1 Tax=Prosthecomicrobium sp. N25 TaxID=3129254 RepID=UPI003077C3F1